MNFKSIAIASLLTLSSLGAVTAPAEARQTNCYFGNAGQTLTREICDVTRRIDYNGHTVFDIRGPIKATIVLWDNNSGEVIMNGRVNRNFFAKYEGNGFYRIINNSNDYNFVFKAV